MRWSVLGLLVFVGCPAAAPVAPIPAPAPETTVIPAETPPAPPVAVASGPEPALKWRGDFCQSDAECAWETPCGQQRCVAGKPMPSPCDEETVATCGCVENQCTRKPLPGRPAFASKPGCREDGDCAIDVPTGTCHVGGHGLIGPITTQGPICLCDKASTECRATWIDPIPCTTWRDCDVTREPRLRPIRAVPPRTKAVKPCDDASVDAICSPQGFCQVVAWSC